jgi:ABC-type sugar transport system substrate-binding protein
VKIGKKRKVFWAPYRGLPFKATTFGGGCLLIFLCSFAWAGGKPESPTGQTKKRAMSYVALGTGTDFLRSLAEAIVKPFKDGGWDVEYLSPDFNPTKQLEIFENCVAQGKDLIVLFPINAEGMNSAVKKAQEQGVKVIVMVNPTETYDALMLSDGAEIAKGVCEIAAEWVEKTFPAAKDRSVPTAFISYYNDANTIAYSNGLKKIEDYSKKIKLVTEIEQPDELLTTGQNIAENLYISHPQVNLVICTAGNVAMGFNAYYTSINSPVKDLTKTGIFSINGNQQTYQAIRDSAANRSVYRGIAMTMDQEQSAQNIYDVAQSIFDGTQKDKINLSPVYKVTAVNATEYIR